MAAVFCVISSRRQPVQLYRIEGLRPQTLLDPLTVLLFFDPFYYSTPSISQVLLFCCPHARFTALHLSPGCGIKRCHKGHVNPFEWTR